MTRRTRSSSGPIGEDRSGGGGGSGPRPVKEIDRSRELDDGSIVQEAGDRPGPPEPAATPGEAGLQGAPDFDTIVGRYGPRLFGLAYRLSGSREDAEDLSQEAMVRAYRSTERFRGEADYFTYLYRIVLNLWRNQLRSRRRWRMVSLWGSGRRDEVERAAPRDLEDAAPGPHDRLVGREQAQRVQEALARLDPGLRAVLILRVAEDLEYEEIAKVLKIPIGTVRSRLARARSRIRRLMTE